MCLAYGILESMSSLAEKIFTLRPDFTDTDRELIIRACDFATKAHVDQVRASGEPYVNHVVATGENLARFGMDATTIAAGILHDTLEDTPTEKETLIREFGEDIVSMVEGVTKLGNLKYKGHERHLESLRKFFIAVAQDVRVLMIKLADRLHNVETLQYVKTEKQKRIALESIEVYAPLANRLGIGKVKGELEDAAFPYAFPKESEMIEKLLAEKTAVSQTHLEDVKNKLTEEFKKQNITPEKIDYRIKHKYSLWRKLVKSQMDIEKIYDIMALRVIVESVEDCYRILGIIHSLWRPLPGRIRDYIALPKSNGYQSIHTIVFTGDGGIVEIQIRTMEMHGRAEYGVASHLSYKQRTERLEKFEDKSFVWKDELKELANSAGDKGDFLDGLKKDFFTNRIFIFTPTGDVIDLPEDSSPIDFAYAVHSEIGDTCASAKINGKMVALSTKLKSGDIVEIMTNKNAKPAAKWLDYTKTSLARKHINAHMKENSLLSKFLSFGK